jgi:hypothetical protein
MASYSYSSYIPQSLLNLFTGGRPQTESYPHEAAANEALTQKSLHTEELKRTPIVKKATIMKTTTPETTKTKKMKETKDSMKLRREHSPAIP